MSFLRPARWCRGLDAACGAALLEELFNHAKGDIKALSDLIASAIAFVIGSDNTFTQVEGKSGHTAS